MGEGIHREKSMKNTRQSFKILDKAQTKAYQAKPQNTKQRTKRDLTLLDKVREILNISNNHYKKR